MNNKILRILIISILSAAAGAVVGYIISRRTTKPYFDNDDVEYVNPVDIDIPIDEETE
jgi:hypothetical protein